MNQTNDKIDTIRIGELIELLESDAIDANDFAHEVATILRAYLELRDQHHALTLDRDAWKNTVAVTVTVAQEELRELREAEAEFHIVVDDGECPVINATTIGPRQEALLEAMRYAEQYKADGTVTVVEQIEVVRFEHPAIAAMSAQGEAP